MALEAAIAKAKTEVPDMPQEVTRRQINESDLIVLPLPSLF